MRVARLTLAVVVVGLVLATAPTAAGASETPDPCPPHDPFPGVAERLARQYPARRFSAAVVGPSGCVHLLNGTTRVTTASVVKVEIMAAVLLRAQRQGRSLTAWEHSQLSPMIAVSADRPASLLYASLGAAPALEAADDAFGLRETTHPRAVWGLAATTAADQVRLVRQLVGDLPGPLAAPGRAEARRLLTSVVPEQRWGASAGVPAAWVVAQKNGFAPSTCCGWRINTVGWIERPNGTGWAIAVLSDGWPTAAEGVHAVHALAAEINTKVLGAPLGHVDRVAGVGGDRVEVAGWAADPDDVNPATVSVRVDGVEVATSAAAGERGDVAAVHPRLGSRRGFSLAVSVPHGIHDVCAVAVNLGPPAPPSTIGCGRVRITTAPFGAVDAVIRTADGVHVEGWAIDPDTTEPVSVIVAVGDVAHDIGPASVTRHDVGAAHPGAGPDHGFDATVSAPAGGRVCVHAVNLGPGADTLLGCQD